VPGERLTTSWRYDRLYLFAIVLYAALALAFAWHFITTYIQPPVSRGHESYPVRAS
jgi:phosphate/sulfate permease